MGWGRAKLENCLSHNRQGLNSGFWHPHKKPGRVPRPVSSRTEKAEIEDPKNPLASRLAKSVSPGFVERHPGGGK